MFDGMNAIFKKLKIPIPNVTLEEDRHQESMWNELINKLKRTGSDDISLNYRSMLWQTV